MNYIYIGVTLILLLAAIAVLFHIKRHNTATPSRAPVAKNPDVDPATAEKENMWRGLRQIILNLKPEEMGLRAGSDDTYGFIMEMSYERKNAKVTIVALRDGTMSMYISTGGGTIGAGQRTQEAGQVARDAVTDVKQYVGMLEKSTGSPVAAPNRTRFFIMTGQGIYTAETETSALERQTDRLSPLFVIGQKVITQIRLASEPATPPASR